MAEFNMDMFKNSTDLARAIENDEMPRLLSFLLFGVMTVLAVFISLVDIGFDLSKFNFWRFLMDLIITTGGGLLLKWVFSIAGDYDGHKNPKVVAVLEEIASGIKTLKETKLLNPIKKFIDESNARRKLKAYRTMIYRRAMKDRNPKKYEKEKEDIRLQELYFKTGDEEILKELEDRNFDLDSLRKVGWFKIKFAFLDEDVILSGNASTKGSSDDGFGYSRNKEVFGKNIIFTVALTFASILLVITDATSALSWSAVGTVVSRVGIYAINSYAGYTVAKTGVEIIKYKKLVGIANFINKFIEITPAVQESEV